MPTYVHMIRANAPDLFNGPDRFRQLVVDALRMMECEVEQTTLPFRGLPDAAVRDRAMEVLAGLPDDTRVFVEAGAVPACVFAVPSQARRLRMVALLHRPAHQLESVSAVDRSRVLAAEQATYRQFDRVLTSSVWGAMALGPLGVLPDQIGLLLPTANPIALSRGSEIPSLLMVGQVTRRKGHLRLIDALDARDDWSLTIAGSLAYEPGYVEELREVIAQRNLDDRVRLVGALTSAELRGAFDRASLFVAASTKDAAGFAVAEATAAGVPALVTQVGGLARNLTPHGGVVCPANDPSMLETLLRSCMYEPAAREKLKLGAIRARDALRRPDMFRRELRRELEIADRLTGRLPKA